MILKKYFIILLIFFISFGKSFAYTTDDYFNIYYQGDNTRADIYEIPAGKDLVINFLYTDDATNSELFFRDNGTDIAGGQFLENKNTIKLVIKDLLQLKDGSSNNNYIITGILINENEDISSIINETEYGINKPIFDLETIQTIYLWEGIIMIFLLLFKFFRRILGHRKTRAGL